MRRGRRHLGGGIVTNGAIMKWRAVAMIGLVVAVLGVAPSAQAYTAPLQLRVEVLTTYPHDTEAFTQGLELHEGVLYEGTGLHGRSEMRTVERDTGTVTKRVALPADAFGEGIAVVGDRIWQLTFQEQFAFTRDRGTLEETGRVSYQGEGWGLCHDADRNRLVMSNGGADLTFRDPETFEPTGTVAVTRDGQPQRNLNELDCAGDDVWANVWLTNEIVRIDVESGAIEAVVDASGLLTPEEAARADVLNGITGVPCTDTYLITGKLWPKMFLVKFVETR
jgi:glutaminyl-peptide cyclotransferase